MKATYSMYEHLRTWVTVLAVQNKELGKVRTCFNEICTVDYYNRFQT